MLKDLSSLESVIKPHKREQRESHPLVTIHTKLFMFSCLLLRPCSQSLLCAKNSKNFQIGAIKMKQYVILLNGQQYQVWASGWLSDEEGMLIFANEDNKEIATFKNWDACIEVAAVTVPAVPQEDKSELANILDAQS